jgi:hypothetical protein
MPAIREILPGGEKRDDVINGMNEVKELLSAGNGENAARRAALSVWEEAERVPAHAAAVKNN